jgi:hypothetical protein
MVSGFLAYRNNMVDETSSGRNHPAGLSAYKLMVQTHHELRNTLF